MDLAAPVAFVPALDALQTRVGDTPEIALVLGSGLGSFADTFRDATSIPYTEIPGMPASSVPGHAGQLVLGRVGTRRVIAMQGRVHLYEGHDASAVVFGVRLMRLLGAHTVILSNAAGGIRADLKPGDIMLLDDHLNLTGHNCLRGANDPALGPRFPDMSEVYSRELREHAEACAERVGLRVKRGVYAGVLGPSYETPAEIRMLRTLGAAAVGMSTVLEAIAARHMSAQCLGLSCITNLAAGASNELLSHEEVQITARAMEKDLARLLTLAIEELPT
ncbi:MAG TPA: purine-nucleoside phosphorylase [Polyangiales bacterium]|jgi:purine-nucleoside phosphorylase|nr:purine-nucleoside phosphorylase [Polyangiales bacterium]